MAVHESLCVVSNCLAYLGMAVTKTGYVDTGGEVDVLVAVNVGKGVAETAVKGNGEKLYLAGIAFHIGRASVVVLFG